MDSRTVLHLHEPLAVQPSATWLSNVDLSLAAKRFISASSEQHHDRINAVG